MAAVLQKDRKATAEFVARYVDSVYSYVRYRLVPQLDLLDDLVQEVFLAAWENLREFRGTSSLEAWLLGIARHKVEDYYRARLRQFEPLEEDVGRESTPVVVEVAFDESLDRARLQEKAQRVLKSLPEPYRLALLWRYWERRSAREMAAQTGKTEKAIERLLAHARELFKRRWNGD